MKTHNTTEVEADDRDGEYTTVAVVYGTGRKDLQKDAAAALIVERVNGWDALEADNERHKALAIRLNQENARLREALLNLLHADYPEALHRAKAAARAALEGRAT